MDPAESRRGVLVSCAYDGRVLRLELMFEAPEPRLVASQLQEGARTN